MNRTYIYVAGASAEVDMVSDYMNKLRKAGLNITHDWTREVKLDKASGKTEFEPVENYKKALNDIRGVDSCDMLWLIVPNNNSLGAWVEYGYAISRSKLVFISGNVNRSIFLELTPQFNKFSTHDAALKHIIELHNSEEWP